VLPFIYECIININIKYFRNQFPYNLKWYDIQDNPFASIMWKLRKRNTQFFLPSKFSFSVLKYIHVICLVSEPTFYFIVSWWGWAITARTSQISVHPSPPQLPTKLIWVCFIVNKHDLISEIDILDFPKSNIKVLCSLCCNLLVKKKKNFFLFTIQGFQFKKCLLWF